MNGCAGIKRMLSRFVDGEATEKEKGLLESHLAACPECAKELALVSKAKNMIAARERKLLPEDFLIGRLRAMLAEEAAGKERFSLPALGNFSRRLIPVPVAAIAFSILLFVLTSGANPSLEDKIIEGGLVSSDTAAALILGVKN